MKYRQLGGTGFEVSAIGYGGIVSAHFYDNRELPGDGQMLSDQWVAWAVDHGVNYFDVAPSYGDAQLMLGNSLKPYRDHVFLACKTNKRKRVDAEREMQESLKLLHTDHFDVYQLHGLVTMEEMETCFAPGGTVELLTEMKEKGIARKIGFTAHTEEVALRALELDAFDTVMFPLNWHMHMGYGMGRKLAAEVKKKGLGLLAIKSMIDRGWDEEERFNSVYPKSWCRPFDVQTEPEYLLAGLRYTDSLGPDVLIPPGNFGHFKFAVEHADEVFSQPLSDAERALLASRLELVKEKPVF